jgi:hypothetical protein
MTIDRYLRLAAGAFVLLSLTLGFLVDPLWYLFTAFVGLNLFQSAFSNWCPLMTVLRKIGIPECRHTVEPQRSRKASAGGP